MKKSILLFTLFSVLLTAAGVASAANVLVCIDSACTSGYQYNDCGEANIHSDGADCSFYLKNNSSSTVSLSYTMMGHSTPGSIAAGETVSVTLSCSEAVLAAQGQKVYCTADSLSSPIWTSTTGAAAVTPEPVVIYPEDENGAYTFNEEGEKIYNWFHKYSICMYFMGDETFCAQFPRL